MKGNRAALSFFICTLSGTQIAAQTKRALLVGINTYQPEGTNAQHPAGCTYGRCELAGFDNLQGLLNSLRVNSQGNELTVLVNSKYVHADSTLVPTVAYKGGDDAREGEMTRIFNSALDKSIHLTIVLTVAGGRPRLPPERTFFSGWNRASSAIRLKEGRPIR